MATRIYGRSSATATLPDVLFKILPSDVYSALLAFVSGGAEIEEIRLRRGQLSTITSGGENIPFGRCVPSGEMEMIFESVCGGSVYAHADTIRKGYVTLEGGIRVGVVGRAATDGGRVVGVYDISALSFRLPRRIARVGEPVCELLREQEGTGGVLVFSPPGHGKTTLLRSVIAKMAGGESPLRVVVIDTREELCAFLGSEALCVDVLTGYPRPLGIEIAARSMNAQLVVCDEIGEMDEARAIIAAQNCGVPLLATAHASDVAGLLRRSAIFELHRAGVFGAYVGIRRVRGRRDYEYSVTYREEADEFFEDIRGGACRV